MESYHQSRGIMKLGDYFLGPRKLDKHSKWPMVFRIHGSCLPQLVPTLLVVGFWSTAVSTISRYVRDMGISSTPLSIYGFVVALLLSFCCATGYERYMEARRAWSTLITASNTLARTIWVNTRVREECAAGDLLGKITALNLIVAYARAVKHHLRFEPYSHYSDLRDLVQHLNTYAKRATDLEAPRDDNDSKGTQWRWTDYIGISLTRSDPRKAVNCAQNPLGNLPLEVLCHLDVYIHDIIDADRFGVTPHHVTALTCLSLMNDAFISTERILNTPLPLAYAIALSQLTWMYILILPFQLYPKIGMLTIPVALAAAYAIFGLSYIRQQIENPFGLDVNALPLDDFCNHLAADTDIIASSTPQSSESFIKHERNLMMHPFNNDGYETWKKRSADEIGDALQKKSRMSMETTRPVGGKKGRKESSERKYEMATAA